MFINLFYFSIVALDAALFISSCSTMVFGRSWSFSPFYVSAGAPAAATSFFFGALSFGDLAGASAAAGAVTAEASAVGAAGAAVSAAAGLSTALGFLES